MVELTNYKNTQKMQRKNSDKQMVSYDYLVTPGTAAKILLLVSDFDLPLTVIIGKIEVIQSVGRKRVTKLRRVTIAVEEENENILEAALVVLGISD